MVVHGSIQEHFSQPDGAGFFAKGKRIVRIFFSILPEINHVK